MQEEDVKPDNAALNPTALAPTTHAEPRSPYAYFALYLNRTHAGSIASPRVSQLEHKLRLPLVDSPLVEISLHLFFLELPKREASVERKAASNSQTCLLRTEISQIHHQHIGRELEEAVMQVPIR